MGIFGLFRKKKQQEKTLIELARDKAVLKQVENAIIIFKGIEDRISDFTNKIAEINESILDQSEIIKTIEQHGFLVGGEFRSMQFDPHETPAVMKSRTARWTAIRKSAEKVLGTLAELHEALASRNGGISSKAKISELLRQQFDEFKETVSANISALFADLQRYPELLSTEKLSARFSEFRKEFERDFSAVNALIQTIISAEQASS